MVTTSSSNSPTQCNLADILDHMGGTSVPTQSLASHNFSLFGVWIFFIASYIWGLTKSDLDLKKLLLDWSFEMCLYLHKMTWLVTFCPLSSPELNLC